MSDLPATEIAGLLDEARDLCRMVEDVEAIVFSDTYEVHINVDGQPGTYRVPTLSVCRDLGALRNRRIRKLRQKMAEITERCESRFGSAWECEGDE